MMKNKSYLFIVVVLFQVLSIIGMNDGSIPGSPDVVDYEGAGDSGSSAPVLTDEMKKALLSNAMIDCEVLKYEDKVNSVAFNHDGTMLASGLLDNTVRLWNPQSRNRICSTLKGHKRSVNLVAFNKDGTMIASGSDDYTVRLWDLQFQECINTLKGHDSFILSVVFNYDGTVLASGSGDKTIRLWNPQSQECATL